MIDSRIEYWYKVIDLVIEHAGTVEILSKEPVGDSVLRVLEEGLKLRAEKIETDHKTTLEDDWREKFNEIGYKLIWGTIYSRWVVMDQTVEHPKNYYAEDFEELADLHSMLVQLEEYT